MLIENWNSRLLIIQKNIIIGFAMFFEFWLFFVTEFSQGNLLPYWPVRPAILGAICSHIGRFAPPYWEQTAKKHHFTLLFRLLPYWPVRPAILGANVGSKLLPYWEQMLGAGGVGRKVLVYQNAFDVNLSYFSCFFSRALFILTSYPGGIISSGFCIVVCLYIGGSSCLLLAL